MPRISEGYRKKYNCVYRFAHRNVKTIAAFSPVLGVLCVDLETAIRVGLECLWGSIAFYVKTRVCVHCGSFEASIFEE